MLSPDHHMRTALVTDFHAELRRRAEAARLRLRPVFVRRPAHAA